MPEYKKAIGILFLKIDYTKSVNELSYHDDVLEKTKDIINYVRECMTDDIKENMGPDKLFNMIEVVLEEEDYAD